MIVDQPPTPAPHATPEDRVTLGLSAFEPRPSLTAPSIAPGPQPAPQVSVVVPGLNEAESLAELAQRVDQALQGRFTYELIFVDDGSTDDTWGVIARIRAENPAVKGIRLRKNFGKAAALTAGFRKARGAIVVTMDADLQDDPADLPSFIAKIEEGLDVVVGWKVNRLDPTNRLVLSRIFNGTVRTVTGVKLHDMNCGFKAYRSEVLRTIPIYGDLFRFIPALAAWQGFRVAEIPVRHHARKYGSSRYGLERILRGFFDLLSVMFLTRYSKKPMHLFGLIGLVFAAIGVTINTYLTLLWFLGHKIGDRPLLLLGVLMILLGIQFFSMGFIGEFLTFQMQQRRHQAEELPVREEIE
ncbi:glycosyltransferase family 2 protein [Sorangium sp. So ce1024]|uniref:glycosyltransferase family 2 protein n=1 Tax=unclassified Sorangium TaxID=2621164 RepID=UPI003F0C87A6